MDGVLTILMATHCHLKDVTCIFTIMAKEGKEGGWMLAPPKCQHLINFVGLAPLPPQSL
jgi:hypothetical protein